MESVPSVSGNLEGLEVILLQEDNETSWVTFSHFVTHFVEGQNEFPSDTVKTIQGVWDWDGEV